MGKRRHSGAKRRFPVVNGIFYPDSPEALTDKLASWGLKESSNTLSFGGQAIIAPHGAWEISGTIAGAAFASTQKRKNRTEYPVNESPQGINRVILLGPCHGFGEEGIYLSESVSFQTPLGNMPVDQELNRKLASCSTLITINDIPHLSEHSLEVLLPIVKYCLSEVMIIPILMEGKRPALISGLAKALRMTLENYMEESLIVISSNVSRNLDPVLALSMADEFGDLLENMDTGAFFAGLAKGRISACGRALVGALLESGLLHGKRFSTLCPLVQGRGEEGETVYYGAFGCSAR